MQLTLDSEEPLEHALRVVGALYGVQLTVVEDDEDDSSGDRVVKVRH